MSEARRNPLLRTYASLHFLHVLKLQRDTGPVAILRVHRRQSQHEGFALQILFLSSRYFICAVMFVAY
jgi:hypothetical protein